MKNIYKVGLVGALLGIAAQAWAEEEKVGEEAAKAGEDNEPVVLSPFEVRKDRDAGYFSAETTAGTRSSTPVIDVPGTISIINAEMLSDLNVTAQVQAINYGTAGITSNEHTRDDVTIRGFRQSHIFRDGIQTSSFVVNQMFDLDRLEVVKGPVAMVFGNGGVLGGAVNFVPRKPTYTYQGEAKVTVGAENNYVRSSLNFSGPLSPTRKDIRYRFTLGGQQDDRTKAVEKDNQLFVGGEVDIDFKNTTFSLYGYYNDLDRNEYFYDFLDAMITDGVMKLNANSTPGFAPADTNQDLYFSSRELYLTATMLTHISDNFDFRGFYRYRSADEPRRLIRGISVAADNVTLNRQILAPYDHYEFDHAAQVDFIYKLAFKGLNQDISFGADFTRLHQEDYLAIYSITPLNTATLDYSADATLQDKYTINSTNSKRVTETVSYYLQDFVSVLNDKVMMVGGLRWIKPRDTLQNYANNTTTITFTPEQMVHRYGIVVKPLPVVSLYYMDAQTFSINRGLDHLGNKLKDSDGIIKEFGVKVFDIPFAGGRVYGSGAYFDMALTNVTTIGPVVTVNGQLLNSILQVSSNTSKGYELELGYRCDLGAGEVETIFTYYDAESRNADGTRTVRAPDEVYSALVKFAFKEGPLAGFTLGGGAYHEGLKPATSRLYYDFGETYTAFAQYRVNRHWLVAVNVDNLTDRRYVASYAAVGLVGSNEGRTTRFTVKYTW